MAQVVGPFLEKHSPSCAQILRSRQSSKVCERDLFFWSILQGDRAYMLFWWKRCGHPLRLALIGAAFARTISTLRVVGLGRTALEDISVLLEGWAVGLISSIDGQEDAFAVLASTVCAWGQRSGAGAPLLDLAMRLEMKTFLSHKHCQALMELWWRGGYYGSAVTLEPNAMMVEVALYAIAPFLNPYLLNCRGHEVAERKVPPANYDRKRPPPLHPIVAVSAAAPLRAAADASACFFGRSPPRTRGCSPSARARWA